MLCLIGKRFRNAIESLRLGYFMRKIIAGIATILSMKGAMAGQGLPIVSKQINYRGWLVVFSLPESWVEEYEPAGGGMFYAPGNNTGTLRLDVISAKSPTSVSYSSVGQVLSEIGYPETENLPTGNAISKRVSRELDRGTPITIFWWDVANVVEPDHVRIASFSYAILSSEEQSTRTKSDLSFLEQSIRNIGFSPTLGE